LSIDLLKEVRDILNDVTRLRECNEELLETLTVALLWVRDYTERNNVPIPNKSNLYSLLSRAKTLIDEMNMELPTIRRFFTRGKSDKDFTEPSLATEKRRDRSVCIIVYFLFLKSIRLSKVVTYSNTDSTRLECSLFS